MKGGMLFPTAKKKDDEVKTESMAELAMQKRKTHFEFALFLIYPLQPPLLTNF